MFHPRISRKKFFNGVRFGWQPIGWLINVINLNKTAHSSEIRGLCLVKWDPSEILQNLHMFWKRWKRAFCFLIPKIWQILKCLAWSIHQAWNPLFAKSVLMLLVCTGRSAAAISWPTRWPLSLSFSLYSPRKSKRIMLDNFQWIYISLVYFWYIIFLV